MVQNFCDYVNLSSKTLKRFGVVYRLFGNPKESGKRFSHFLKALSQMKRMCDIELRSFLGFVTLCQA